MNFKLCTDFSILKICIWQFEDDKKLQHFQHRHFSARLNESPGRAIVTLALTSTSGLGLSVRPSVRNSLAAEKLNPLC